MFKPRMLNIAKMHREILVHEVYDIIGLAHAQIMVAETVLEDKRIVKPIKKEEGFFVDPVKLTPYGEATKDFVPYFLRNNVKNIVELKTLLENVHPHLVDLKRASEKMTSRFSGAKYLDLLQSIDNFVKEHTDKLVQFAKVVDYLHELDVIAPSIFFTHPQWSTSQISDRWLHIHNIDELHGGVKRAAEIVLGLWYSGGYTYYHEKSWLESKRAESIDPEKTQSVFVPATQIFSQTAGETLSRLALYYNNIRLCCENILKHIDLMFDGSILDNSSFLDLFIRKAMEKARTETTLWDFKISFPAWHKRSDEQDERLASDIAAYANNRGGILIVGISNNRVIMGVPRIEERIKLTKDIIGRKIGNKNIDIKIVTLPMEKEDGVTVPCLLIIIPQSSEPTSVIKADKSESHPFRNGVGIKYLSRSEIVKRKVNVPIDNLMYARELVDFVFNNKVVE